MSGVCKKGNTIACLVYYAVQYITYMHYIYMHTCKRVTDIVIVASTHCILYCIGSL